MAELPNLLAALERLDAVGGHDVHVCLLLDGCVDASLAIAAAYRTRSRHHVAIEQTARGCSNAGVARHRAMMLGMEQVRHDEGLLLTTDADSRPATDWLQAMVAGLRQADVLAGRVVRDKALPNPLQDRIEAYYDRLFALRRQLDPVPWEAPNTHHHTGGANIGVRVAAYRASGGFVPLARGEDARFVDDASRAGLRVRRDADAVVGTSARRHGRVVGGLACALRDLDGTEPEGVRVTHPVDAAWQYRLHAIARRAHDDGRLDLAAAAVGLSRDHVRGVARDCANSEAFAMRVVPEPRGGMRSVTLPVAEVEVARMLGQQAAA